MMLEEVKRYIEALEPPRPSVLKKIRNLIRKTAPSGIECMRYGVPAFTLKGGTVMYAAFKGHIGLYPEPATIKAFQKELKGYGTSKGAIQFALDEPMPYDLIEKIIKFKNQP